MSNNASSMEVVEKIINEFSPIISSTHPLNPEETILPEFEADICEPLCQMAVDTLAQKGSLIKLSLPIVVVGDVHGSIFDLLRVFQVFGMPPKTKYLFLGDYVDRGSHSIEVICLLLALLSKYPEQISLLRGNHEFAHINRVYGFYNDIMNNYNNEDIWLYFQSVFSYLPLAAIINNAIFCIHGGLSPSLVKPSDISDIELPIISYEGNTLISDLVWSDPHDESSGFTGNQRGSGVLFGPDAVSSFLVNNHLKIIVRAHQCVADGFQSFASNYGITVFSSSNYCNIIQNKCGAICFKPGGDVELYALDNSTVQNVAPKYIYTYNSRAVGMRRKFIFGQQQDLPPLIHSESAQQIVKQRTPIRSSVQENKNIGISIPRPPPRSPMNSLKLPSFNNFS